MPTLNLGGESLYYFERPISGSSLPPLVLVHGAGGYHLSWPPQVRRLPGVSVYAPDLPGHGQSGGMGRQAIPDYAADLLSFMDGLGIGQAVIAGHSMGGAIALHLAIHQAERVAGVVLIATGARLPVTPAILDRVLDEPEAAIDFIIANAYGPQASEELRYLGRLAMLQTGPEVLHADFAACNAFNVMGDLAAITAPTLVIGGGQDRMAPLKYATYLAENIGGAELSVIEEVGHMIPVEAPEQTAALIGGWLKRCFGQGSATP